MKTITYDETKYMLVPIDLPYGAMDGAFDGITLSEAHTEYGVTERVWHNILTKLAKTEGDVQEG